MRPAKADSVVNSRLISARFCFVSFQARNRLLLSRKARALVGHPAQRWRILSPFCDLLFRVVFIAFRRGVRRDGTRCRGGLATKWSSSSVASLQDLDGVFELTEANLIIEFERHRHTKRSISSPPLASGATFRPRF